MLRAKFGIYHMRHSERRRRSAEVEPVGRPQVGILDLMRVASLAIAQAPPFRVYARKRCKCGLKSLRARLGG